MTEYGVSQKLTAAGQPTLAKIEEIAAADYAAIINLRPDAGAADQPDHDDAERVARRVGLKYIYIPVTVEALTNADVNAFKEAIDSIDGRVYARHGTTTETRLTVIDRLPADDPSCFPVTPGMASSTTELLAWVDNAIPARLPISAAFTPSRVSGGGALGRRGSARRPR